MILFFLSSPLASPFSPKRLFGLMMVHQAFVYTESVSEFVGLSARWNGTPTKDQGPPEIDKIIIDERSKGAEAEGWAINRLKGGSWSLASRTSSSWFGSPAFPPPE